MNDLYDKFCIIQGDPVRGFIIIGPFDSEDEASAYAEIDSPNETWWVQGMVPLREEESA